MEFGHTVPYERIRPVIGMGGDKVLPLVAGLSADEGDGQRIVERRDAIFVERYLPRVRAFPGAQALLVRLREEGLRLAVASSSKPDPDIVTAALKRLGEPPAQAVMVGDTPYDVEAARAAGIGSLAFRCGGWDDAGLEGALAVYDGPMELLQRYGQSVLAPVPASAR